MKKEILNKVKEVLNGVGIETVMLYRIPSVDMIAKSPFAMIEFPELGYQDNSGLRQEVTPRFIVHLLFDTIESEDDDAILDTTQDVFVAMSRTDFKRVGENSKIFDESTIDWQITFDAPRYVDDDAVIRYITKPKPPIDIQL